MSAVGDRIARARVKARLSQRELGTRIGAGRSWIAAVERGNVHQPSPPRLRLVADEIGLDYRELLALSDQLGAVEPQKVSEGVDLASAITRQNALLEKLIGLLERPNVAADLLVRAVAEASADAKKAAGQAEDPIDAVPGASRQGTRRK